jgi:hypothetical protein
MILAALVPATGHVAPSTVPDAKAAIIAGKKIVATECPRETPCTFHAKPDGANWEVFVQFTKRNSPTDEPRPYPGGHAILVIDKDGKLVRRLDGE